MASRVRATSTTLKMYDLTIPEGDIQDDTDYRNMESLIITFREYCTRWVFQLEQGEETGYRHFQCRISFGTAKRPDTAIRWAQEHIGPCRITPTCNTVRVTGNEFYVTKDETRIAGPWKDNDEVPAYVPKRFRGEITWRKWQEQFLSKIDIEEDRFVNILLEETGNIGKTFVCTYLTIMKRAVYIPVMDESKDVMAMVLAKEKHNLYLIDIPRAASKKFMNAMYTAVEMIKNGYAYDSRYKWRDEFFEPPQVWIFTNTRPPHGMLSKDRFKIWKVNTSGDLVHCPTISLPMRIPTAS